MEWLRVSVAVAVVAVCASIAEAQWAFQPQRQGANVEIASRCMAVAQLEFMVALGRL